jgi:hypothetical protein
MNEPTEPTPAELALLAALTSPQSVTIDGNNTQTRPIGDLIAADKYLRSRAVRCGIGIRTYKVLAPGVQ